MKLVYLSPVSWHSFAQRPHELVRQFHAFTQAPVLWVEPYPTRLPVLADLLERRPAHAQHQPQPDWLTLSQPWALPIEPLPGSGWLNRLFWRPLIQQVRDFAQGPTQLGIGKPSHLALQLLREPIFDSSFYDVMDNVPAFYHGWSRRAMSRRQHETAKAVTMALTSCSSLQHYWLQQEVNARLLLNGCASERLPPLPLSRPATPGQRRVFGYVGTLAKWFDWDFIRSLALEFPEAEVRLIGPQHGPIPSSLPPNILRLPALSHEAALETMTEFDIGLIPFKRNDITRFVDPIKYYEYRALGLPVVSTIFGEMSTRRHAPGVFLSEAVADIPRVIHQALAFNEPLGDTLRFREANSWTKRFEVAHATIL
nr:glycosyl transferase [Pseudomonas sp. FFPRI_1]